MRLQELSQDYHSAALAISLRIQELHQQEIAAPNEVHRAHLHRRIQDLRPLQQQCRELEHLTAHYYDRSFHNGKYGV